MKKDFTRDYAAEALIFYALHKDENPAHFSEAENADFVAAQEVITAHGDDLKIKAVLEVYLATPKKKLRVGQIKERVTAFGQKYALDTSTVYRYLREIRLEFAQKRGLRI